MANDIDQAALRAAFGHFFGLTPTLAGLLCSLFNARGEFLTIGQLAVLQSGNRDAILQRVSRLRAAMECEAIDTEDGKGYRLTLSGLDECQQARAAMAESLARA